MFKNGYRISNVAWHVFGFRRYITVIRYHDMSLCLPQLSQNLSKWKRIVNGLRFLTKNHFLLNLIISTKAKLGELLFQTKEYSETLESFDGRFSSSTSSVK